VAGAGWGSNVVTFILPGTATPPSNGSNADGTPIEWNNGTKKYTITNAGAAATISNASATGFSITESGTSSTLTIKIENP
jgi:hypothetical protein